jgi:hypothetical protein
VVRTSARPSRGPPAPRGVFERAAQALRERSSEALSRELGRFARSAGLSNELAPFLVEGTCSEAMDVADVRRRLEVMAREDAADGAALGGFLRGLCPEEHARFESFAEQALVLPEG